MKPVFKKLIKKVETTSGMMIPQEYASYLIQAIGHLEQSITNFNKASKKTKRVIIMLSTMIIYFALVQATISLVETFGLTYVPFKVFIIGVFPAATAFLLAISIIKWIDRE